MPRIIVEKNLGNRDATFTRDGIEQKDVTLLFENGRVADRCRPAEASAALETALRLDPRPSPQGSLRAGWILYHLHQYERAIAMLQRAREATPHNFNVSEGLAMSYAQLGRLDEAKAKLQAMQKMWPRVNLTVFRVLLTFKRQEDLAHVLGGLQKAGMPEWPYGFAGREEDRLNGGDPRANLDGQSLEWEAVFGDDQPTWGVCVA